MLTRQISLKRGTTTKAVNITEDKEIQQALTELEIPHPKPVIVLVGGASKIGWWDTFPMGRAIRVIARLAEEAGAVVVDGGTEAGIMKEMGQQRNRHKYSFPLVGVVFDTLLMQQEPKSILDPNHTHFILIPGDTWGDESAWISKIATAIAVNQKSITVLVNGGEISQSDVEYSVLADRPTYVMRGTGRLADEIALSGKVFPVDVTQKTDEIFKTLRATLT